LKGDADVDVDTNQRIFGPLMSGCLFSLHSLSGFWTVLQNMRRREPWLTALEKHHIWRAKP